MAASATSLSTLSSLSTPKSCFSLFNPSLSLSTTLHSPTSKSPYPSLSLPSKPTKFTPLQASPSGEIETTFFDNFNPEDDITFDPPEAPEGFVPPPSFDEDPLEPEDQIAAAYEELYGPAYSGMSVLGKDVYVMDSKVKKLTGLGKAKKEKVRDGFDERVVQVRRVTKVVKGGKQLHFRAVVVVGDKQGRVGVGVGKAKEVIAAVQKSATNARRNIITVPMTKYLTFPHRQQKGRPWCEHCRKPGHSKDNCWEIHGKLADWKPRQSTKTRGYQACSEPQPERQQVESNHSDSGSSSHEQLKKIMEMLATLQASGQPPKNTPPGNLAHRGPVIGDDDWQC